MSGTGWAGSMKSGHEAGTPWFLPSWSFLFGKRIRRINNWLFQKARCIKQSHKESAEKGSKKDVSAYSENCRRCHRVEALDLEGFRRKRMGEGLCRWSRMCW